MRVGWSSWSMEVHPEWEVTDDPEFIALEHSDEGAFLLSSAIKEDGDVQVRDIEAIAQADGSGWGRPRPARFGDFSGVVYAFVEDDEHWRRWFLSLGTTLLFATYNGTAEALEDELEDVEAMLSTLEPELPDDEAPGARKPDPARKPE